ncbi:hypothetical protein PFISCL1PPCAC_7416, partial [Pristionchus fissidentatus]
MTCVDEFAVDAGEAWIRMEEYVGDLGNWGYLSDIERSDLLRRLKLSRNFLEGSYRCHIELTSNVIDHCATFALSDTKK